MKFVIRRLVASILTLPIVLVVYGFIYFGLALVANSYASMELFIQNFYSIGLAWVLVSVLAPNLFRAINKFAE